MDAVLQACAVVYEMKPQASSLALGADGRIGQPDGRHEIPSREFGQDPGVDAVGLGR